MQTLEDILRARTGGSDSRAATALIEARKEGLRIILGAVGGLGKIVIGVDGDDVSVLYPSAAADAAESGEGDATNVRRPPDLAAGEYVDDRNPLKPGENPADAPARIEAEGLSPRQPETVSTTTGIASAIPAETGVAGDGAPAGASEVKNPAEGGEGGGDQPEAVDPDAFSKDDLIALAGKEGAEIKSNDTKAEIAAAINAKRGIAAK